VAVGNCDERLIGALGLVFARAPRDSDTQSAILVD
jgi:hypothetical protein